jgi:hypothetical protein
MTEPTEADWVRFHKIMCRQNRVNIIAMIIFFGLLCFMAIEISVGLYLSVTSCF